MFGFGVYLFSLSSEEGLEYLWSDIHNPGWYVRFFLKEVATFGIQVRFFNKRLTNLKWHGSLNVFDMPFC